jgi:hypothetical protein
MSSKTVVTDEFKLEQFCRALAIHAMIVGHPAELRKFMAPETSETVADIILRFARGERVGRPPLDDVGDNY